MPGHDWGYASGSTWVPVGGFGEEEYCPACTTYRRAVVDIFGNKTPWAYEYPDDYPTDIPISELRLMVVRKNRKTKRTTQKANVVPLQRKRA